MLKGDKKRSTRHVRNVVGQKEPDSLLGTSLGKYVRNKTKSVRAKNLMRKSLYDYEQEKFIAWNTVLFYQRVFIFAVNQRDWSLNTHLMQSDEGTEKSANEEAELLGDEEEGDVSKLHRLGPENVELMLRTRLNEIVNICNQGSITEDQLTGLFLFMGEHTLLVVESTEDVIDVFCAEFTKKLSDLLLNNKVFMIEDNISTTFFDSFICKTVSPTFMSDKFPNNAADNEYIMKKQHHHILEKLHALCSTFTPQDIEEEAESLTTTANETENDAIQLDLFKKFIPEVQRIDLVLSSTRFYRSMANYSRINDNVAVHQDDEELCWPVKNNYTPYGIYHRSEFDYNLTYPESNITSEEKTDRPSLIDGQTEEMAAEEDDEENEFNAEEEG